MRRERTYRLADPADLMALTAGLSGLDLARAMAEGRIPPPPVASLIGVNGMTVEKGKVLMILNPPPGA